MIENNLWLTRSFVILSQQLIKQIEHHFNHYKDLKKPGSTKVEGWHGLDEAKKVIKDAIARWKK